ncbi:MAG TPA: D-glycero-beta-D-manno-heptose-7-phosphate kinase [Methylocystis sp.]|nr:D-glycero-beta-D-manno-heptose-7-phosphate kinase [Methylocystis sp.]
MAAKLVQSLASRKVAVIGDLILDIYLHGAVDRISPEAPVPIIKWKSERAAPGGAANVAANIAAIGAAPHLVGVAGDDEAFRELAALLQTFGGVELAGVLLADGRATTRKLRVVGQAQQILRIDREDDHPLDNRLETRLIETARAAIDACEIAVLSDYGKGALTDRVLASCIAHANANGKQIVVDPKRRDLSAYRGATLITPNRAELAAATGLACETDAQAALAAAKARDATESDILLTRSEKGMSYFSRLGEAIHLPTAAKAVFDVSGAGDTVVAMLAACLAADLPMVEAMKIANHAAGVVVGKFGTAALTPQELLASLAASHMEDVQDGRLLSLEDACALRNAWRDQGYSVGVANGCFDLVHPGHVSLIAQASAACDRLVLALNSDASTRRLKGPTRPVQSEQARAEVAGALKGVAAVVLFGEDTPLELLEALQPDVLVKGADYQEHEIVGADGVRARGGRVLRATLVDGQSTTRLLAKST